MEETLFVSFEPRELQFATSQSRNENSLLMAWCASSALGQGCDGTPTGSHPWGKLSGGGGKGPPAHPSQCTQELCQASVHQQTLQPAVSTHSKRVPTSDLSRGPSEASRPPALSLLDSPSSQKLLRKYRKSSHTGISDDRGHAGMSHTGHFPLPASLPRDAAPVH